MNSLETYTNLWNENRPLIQKNQIQTDSNLHALSEDTRLGITLCCRPDKDTQKKIQGFLSKSAKIEPHHYHYHYPQTSLHTTVLSVITTGTNFKPEELNIENYRSLIEEALKDLSIFSIEYKGITASSGAVMIQGFPTDDTLETIRAALRDSFKKSALFTTMDARYLLHTAHMTCIRFKEPLKQPEKYAKFLNSWRDVYFGKSTIEEIELVLNDWYMIEEKTKSLATFSLKKG